MIRFVAKVAVQRLLGAVPGGGSVYGWLQRRSILADLAADIRPKRRCALSYLDLLERHAGWSGPTIGTHLEMGSGWLPTIPLTFRRHGVARQILTDIRPYLLPRALPAIDDVLDGRPIGTAAPVGDMAAATRWLADRGIVYHAPVRPPFPVATGSIDLVTSTQILIYPPADGVRALHEEAARLLRPGGLYLGIVRLDDLYALADPALPRFHFLRYGDATWRRWFDNPFAPLNRLRAADHRRLFDGLPFEPLLWRVEGGGPDDLEALRRSRPHRQYADWDEAELARTHILFLLRRL